MDNTVAFDALWWDIWGIFFVFNQPHLGWVALLHLQKTELQFLMETEEGHWGGGVSAQGLSEKCLLIQFCLWIAVIFWMEEGVRWPRVLNWWICRNRNLIQWRPLNWVTPRDGFPDNVSYLTNYKFKRALGVIIHLFPNEMHLYHFMNISFLNHYGDNS